MPFSLEFIMQDLREFYKIYLPFKNRYLLLKVPGSRNRKSKMPNIHIMAIMILGQLFGGGNFCLFYQGVVCRYMRKHFRNLVSYSWFIRLRQKVSMDLFFFLKYKSITKGDCFFIDSTPIKVCHNRRIKRRKTFKKLALRGHHSMGWFFGFKLHVIINNNGELVKFKVTRENVSDIKGLEMAENLEGLLVGDKGYISQQWEKHLAKHNLKLITKTRKNMKLKIRTPRERFFLSHRSIIETVFSQMKARGLQNTKLRSIGGWILNLLSTLSAFVIQPLKPPIHIPKNSLIRN